MRFRITLIVAAMVSLAAMGSSAHGQGILNPGPPPVDGGSWNVGVTFNNAGFGAFDTFESFIVFDNGSGPFAPLGMRNPTNAWSSSTPNLNYSIISGPGMPAATAESWTYHFAGSSANIVRIDFLGWIGGVGGSLDFAANIDYTNGNRTVQQAFGGAYSFLQHPTGFGQQYNRNSAIPEPSTALLLGLGMLGAGLIRRKRRS